MAARSLPGTPTGATSPSSRCSRVCSWTTACRPVSRAVSSATSRAAGSAPLTARTSSPRSCSTPASATAASPGIDSTYTGCGAAGAVRIATPTTAPPSSTTAHHRGPSPRGISPAAAR